MSRSTLIRLLLVFVALLATPSAVAAIHGNGRAIPVAASKQLRLALARSYGRSHHLEAAKLRLTRVQAARYDGASFALARVAGQTRQPELFRGNGAATVFKDQGASAGKPCSLPAPVLSLFGYAHVCGSAAPVPGTTTPATGSSVGQGHFCSLLDRCDSPSAPQICSTATDCVPLWCAMAAKQAVYAGAMYNTGSQMMTTIPIPPSTQTEITQLAIANVLTTVGEQAMVQTLHDAEMYCAGADADAIVKDFDLGSVSVSISFGTPVSEALDLGDFGNALRSLLVNASPALTSQTQWTESVSVSQDYGSEVSLEAGADGTSGDLSLSVVYKHK